VGDGVAIAAQAQVRGPVWIEGDTWVGSQALIADSRIERGAAIEPGAVVIGVRIPRECYVPAGAVIDRQEVADRLPEITASYRYRHRARALLAKRGDLLRAHLPAEAERSRSGEAESSAEAEPPR
jgi:carbonic anhydrase/acetyltransferase-like protein (isoleucine patch superfamily)